MLTLNPEAQTDASSKPRTPWTECSHHCGNGSALRYRAEAPGGLGFRVFGRPILKADVGPTPLTP